MLAAEVVEGKDTTTSFGTLMLILWQPARGTTATTVIDSATTADAALYMEQQNQRAGIM